MTRTSRSVARGFTLIELLLVLAILAIAVGLIVTGVSRVRVSAARSQSMNNLRQIGISLNGMRETYRGVCPSYGQFKDKVGGFFFHIIPFLEAGPLYSQTRREGTVDANGTTRIRTYHAPLDDSHDGTGPECSYACNGAVFLESNPTGLLPAGAPETGGARLPINSAGDAHLIVVVERYAVTPDAGGRHHWNTNAPSGVRGTTINATSNGVTDAAPPVQFGVPSTAITATTDLTAHAFTASGCLVLLADASTRTVSPSINNAIPGGGGVTVFQWACDPAKVLPPPEGW